MGARGSPAARDPAAAARPGGAWWRGGEQGRMSTENRAPSTDGGLRRKERGRTERAGEVLPSRGGLGHRGASGTGATGPAPAQSRRHGTSRRPAGQEGECRPGLLPFLGSSNPAFSQTPTAPGWAAQSLSLPDREWISIHGALTQPRVSACTGIPSMGGGAGGGTEAPKSGDCAQSP